jgi:hypothetical protein
VHDSYPSPGADALGQPAPGFTAEDVQRAAAHVCAQSLRRLDHPSGTGDFLEDKPVTSARAAGRPTTWSILPAEHFTAVTRRLYLLILTAADHTSHATTIPRPPRPASASTSLDFLLPPGAGRWATGADIRHAAIDLARDLIDDDLREGPIFSSILDKPIASRFTLDDPAPTWSHLPARQLIPALRLIHQAVEQAQHQIDAAVGQAIHTAAPPSRPAATAQANTHSATAHPPPEPATAPHDAQSVTNRADQHGTDIEIWYEHWACAQTRTGMPQAAHRILSEHGFTVQHPFLGPDCRILVDAVWPDDQAHATRAAEALTRAGFDIWLDPMLLSRQALNTDHAERLRRQQAAATRTSPATGTQTPAHPASPEPINPSPPAPNGAHRTR